MYDDLLKDAKELLDDLKKCHQPYDENTHFHLLQRYLNLSLEISLPLVSESSINDTQAKIESEVSSMKNNLKEYIIWRKKASRKRKLEKIGRFLKKIPLFIKLIICAILAIIAFFSDLGGILDSSLGKSIIKMFDQEQTTDSNTQSSSIGNQSTISISESTINELCELSISADTIDPQKFNTTGLLTSLMDDFNIFAKKYNLIEIDSCKSLDAGFERINKCGIDKLTKIRRRLNRFRLDHNIKCDNLKNS